MAAWVRRKDRAGRLRVEPYQEAPSPPMTPRLYEACARAVHLITPDGRVYQDGRAVLAVLGLLGWRWTTAVLSLPPLVWAVELGYRIVAGNRPFFGRFLFRR
jgi:predicted DCC family thiol-disulfide oxidoreductase YuxK